MGALNSMMHTDAEVQALTDKKAQYRKDLEEQVRLKELQKQQDPLAAHKPAQHNSDSNYMSSPPPSYVERVQSAPHPQMEPRYSPTISAAAPAAAPTVSAAVAHTNDIQPAKVDTSPKHVRMRFDQNDSHAHAERLKKQRERQEMMEALQKQQEEKRRLLELEKKRDEEKFARIYKASETESAPVQTGRRRGTMPDPDTNKASLPDPVKSEAKSEAKSEVKYEEKLDEKAQSKSDEGGKGEEKKKRHSSGKGRRRHSRRRSHSDSPSESSSDYSSYGSESASGSSESSDGERRRRRHHRHHKKKGRTPDEQTLALVRQAIEEEQAKLQQLILQQQQQNLQLQLQLQQQQLQQQQQQQQFSIQYPTKPQPDIPAATNNTINNNKPPPILNTARKQFLAQIDPDTVLANGKVNLEAATQTTERALHPPRSTSPPLPATSKTINNAPTTDNTINSNTRNITVGSNVANEILPSSSSSSSSNNPLPSNIPNKVVRSNSHKNSTTEKNNNSTYVPSTNSHNTTNNNNKTENNEVEGGHGRLSKTSGGTRQVAWTAQNSGSNDPIFGKSPSIPRPRTTHETVRKSLAGESTFIFPLKKQISKSKKSGALLIFDEESEKHEKSSALSLFADGEEEKKDKGKEKELSPVRRSGEPIFAAPQPPSTGPVVPLLPYEPSKPSNSKRNKRLDEHDIHMPPSLPSTHRSSMPSASSAGIVSSKSEVDVASLAAQPPSHLHAHSSAPPTALGARPAKVLWDLVSPDGRDIQTPQVFAGPARKSLWG